jgi:hypothetical protein
MRQLGADAVQVGQPNFNPFVAWQVNAFNTHICFPSVAFVSHSPSFTSSRQRRKPGKRGKSPLSLTLLMRLVLADYIHAAAPAHDFALGAPLSN